MKLWGFNRILQLFFGGGIVALQCSVSFCCTMKWLSYMYTYTPPLEPPSHYPPHPIHLGLRRAPSWAPCAILQVPTSDLFYTWQCTYINPNLPIHPPHCVHTSVPYVCVSIPVRQIGSSVRFFFRAYYLWDKNEPLFHLSHSNFLLYSAEHFS